MATYSGISKLYIIQIHIYLFFRFTDKVRGTKTEQSDVATYGGRSHLYLLQLWIWLIYCFIDIHDGWAQSQVSSKWQILFIYYVRINMSQICTFWTKIQGYHITRLVWFTRIIFRFFSYLGNCPLNSKTGGCWNLLESTPARIPLINSSHKWTRILFIISNSKLEIWLCSQPRIDLNSKSKY